jgi:hypothetical protein
LLCLFLVFTGAQAWAAEDIDTLARDVDRLISLRQVKDLQRSYAQYAQSGQWDEMAALFTGNATFIRGAETLTGRKAIADWLTRRGGGKRGLPAGALHTELIDEPLANLSVDGRSAKVRWMSLSFLGDGKGKARIEGGLYENEYVREAQGWKISVSHYYAQYSGSYEEGWTNEGGADLPIIPYHFTVDESGVPVPPPAGPAPHSDESLASLLPKIDRLNDEDLVRNLQHAYGYYVDRKMWDDVVDLFTANPVVEIKGVGTFKGAKGVRQAMERMGAAGLQHGQLNDHPLFDTIVQVLPGGREALSRGIDLGMIGEADKGTARWELSVFRNRFVKEDGVWKLKELNVYPIMDVDYSKGWANEGVVRNVSLPPMLNVTIDKRVRPGAKAASTDTALLAEARRRLARSMAYDGTENVSAAYGYYIDDFQWPNMGAIFAEHGSKQSPFAGYYFGRERISQAAFTMYGRTAPTTRAGIAFHWRTQPVINVSADGRSANLRTRLFHPDTGKQSAALGGRGGAAIMSGMYPNDQTVLENGIWRLWSLEIDEPYFTMAGWKAGWSGVKPKPPGSPRPPLSPLVARMAPDILMTELGRRADGFRGGTGETVEWPGILPMWFNYRNPVSGREPALYWPDCVPCELKPEARMTNYGYQMPPSVPEKAVAVE